jgi:putative lipoic acid-binding regulatory protein
MGTLLDISTKSVIENPFGNRFNKLAALQELLERESYPCVYQHKIIGFDTTAFLTGVQSLVTRFPYSSITHQRRSQGAKAQAAKYISVTISISAHNASQIIEIIKATAEVIDLKMVL